MKKLFLIPVLAIFALGTQVQGATDIYPDHPDIKKCGNDIACKNKVRDTVDTMVLGKVKAATKSSDLPPQLLAYVNKLTKSMLSADLTETQDDIALYGNKFVTSGMGW